MAPLTLALVLLLPRDRPAFLDRLERDRAVVLERGRTRAVPRGALPRRAREGDVLAGGAPDPDATAAARRRIRDDAARVRWRAD